MNNKLKNLEKHLQEVKNKLSEQTPAKHKSHPETYKNFLTNEVKLTQNTINRLKVK